MIVNERLVTYINSLAPEKSQLLNQIEDEAQKDCIPIIKTETQTLLRFLMQSHMPRDILEVGTAVGFSAILMKEYNPCECRIVTIENYEKRIPVAKQNFQRAGYEQTIKLLEGDASMLLKELEGSFDFIFMDAAKAQYIIFLPEVIRLLKPGGMLVSDNVLQDGEIIESKYAVMRRNRTIHKRMRQYLYELTHNSQLNTILLPIGDGVTISTKLEQKEEPHE
ncbi:MAG: O-methyltransferase [Lachnospiraceae bacterium]